MPKLSKNVAKTTSKEVKDDVKMELKKIKTFLVELLLKRSQGKPK